MKEAKKSEETAASRATVMARAWAERENAGQKAKALLTQLEGWLEEHSTALKMRILRCSRLDAVAQRLVNNGMFRCMETDAAVLAAQLLAGKNLSAIVLEEQNMPQLKKYYASINFGAERAPNVVGSSEELIILKEVDFERASIEILKVAILLQKKITADAAKAAMDNFSSIVHRVPRRDGPRNSGRPGRTAADSRTGSSNWQESG